MALITSLNPISYQGTFEGGTFSCDQNKVLTGINASSALGSFDAYRMDADNFNYNFHLTDVGKAKELADWAAGLVESIQAELASEE